MLSLFAGRRLLGAVLLLCCSMLPASAAVPAIVLSNQEYLPYMGENLPQGGMLSVLVREVFARAGVRVHYRWYPNNRALQLARSGRVGGSIGWTPTPERSRDLLFSDEVLPFRMVLFQRAGADYPWRTLADLAPYRFGVTTGNFYSTEFESLWRKGALQVEEAGDDASNLRKLASGRIDLFPMEGEAGLLAAHYYLAPQQAATIVAQPRAYWSTPLCLAISRRQPHGRELLAAFNRELGKMKASGELQRLLDASRRAIYAQRVPVR